MIHLTNLLKDTELSYNLKATLCSHSLLLTSQKSERKSKRHVLELTFKAEIGVVQLKGWDSIFIKMRTATFLTVPVKDKLNCLLHTWPQLHQSPNWSCTSLNCHINHHLGVLVVFLQPKFPILFRHQATISQLRSNGHNFIRCLQLLMRRIPRWCNSRHSIISNKVYSSQDCNSSNSLS